MKAIRLLPFLLAASHLPARGAAGAEFRSPNGATETCAHSVRMPGARYLPSDEVTERRYCSLDFHSKTVALCPKMWSTSPATIVYDVSGGRFPGDPAAFEKESCPKGGPARRDATAEPAIYKMSVNAPTTSGTFAPASLLYYHMARYFQTELQVPVAVYRTIDKGEHRRRVIEPGLRYTAGRNSLRMLHEGWRYLDEAAVAGPAPAERSETLTPDGSQLFGVLLNEKGTRYGPEVNGSRAGGWGEGQNRAFQRTAPFLALRQPGVLQEAIREGILQSRRDPAVANAMKTEPSAAQMVYWMRELSEIALLDYLLGQQDRIGNVDYVEEWYWVRDDRLEHRPVLGKSAPVEAAAYRPQRIRRTWLNDNDAGVRASYSDFARVTHMLDGLRHLSAVTYLQLLFLDRDFQSKGERYEFLTRHFPLTPRELELVVSRTREAAAVLQSSCRAGRLRFDLEPADFLLRGSVQERTVACDLP